MKFLNLSHYYNNDYEFPEELVPINIEGNKSLPEYLKEEFLILDKSNYGNLIVKLLHNEGDQDMLLSLVSNYGINYKSFYYQLYRSRLNSFLTLEELNSKRLLEVFDQHYNYSYIDFTSKKGRILTDIVRLSLLRFNNDLIYKELIDWITSNSQLRTCKVCGNNFYPIKLPSWVYYGANGNNSVCYECPISSSPSKIQVKSLIKELVNVCGFIPNADFHPINYKFSSRIKSTQWVIIYDIVLRMGISGNDVLHSNTIFKKIFGSWFKALVESEILPEGVLNTGRGVRCIAKSGNECNSLDEMYIDNWFYENGIITEKEPLYPKHNIYNKHGKRRADWYVNNHYVEYFGLKGEENYDKKTYEKLKLAQQLDLNLISIFPSDLNNLNILLKRFK